METDIPLRILFVEDVPADAELAERMLRQDGLVFTSTLVDTEESFLRELEEFRPDLIISDYAMPNFDGMSALKLTLERNAALPFILLTGAINEETAVACMKAGATDYIVKEHMKRLSFAVREALERKKARLAQAEAETALQSSEERYRALFAATADGMVIADIETQRFGYANPALCQMLGYTEEQLRTMGVADLHPKDALQRVMAEFEAQGRGEKTLAPDIPCLKKDGTILYADINAVPSIIDGRACMVGLFHDITEQKRAENLIRVSKEEWERTFDTVPDLICILDAKHTILRVNRAMAEKLGMSPNEAVGKTCYEYVHGLQSPPDFCPHVQLLKDKQEHTSEFHESRLGGDFLLTCTPWHDRDGQVLGSVHVAHDITERKRVEQTLRESEARYRAVAQSANDAIVTINATGDVVGWNRRAEILFGYTETEIIGRPVTLLVPDRYGDRHLEGLGRLQDGGEPRLLGSTVELEGLRKDGSEFPLELSLSQWEVGDGRHYTGIIRDITGRKRAREALRQQLTRISLLNEISHAIAARHDLSSVFHVVLDHLEDQMPVDFGGVLLVNAHEDTLTVAARGPKSATLAAELDIQEGAIVRVDDTDLRTCVQGETVYTHDVSLATAPIPLRMAETGLRSMVGVPLRVEKEVPALLVVMRQGVGAFSIEEVEFLKTVGEQVGLAARQAKLYEDLRSAYDELRRTQQQSLQQERLRALGQMASGIAHDFNNALSPVVGFSELMLASPKMLDDKEAALRNLRMIATGARDATNVVSRLKEFYRKREEGECFLPLDLNAVVTQAISLTQPRWKDQALAQGIAIEIETDLQKVPVISGDESELREALTNLIFNAVDAMPEGGVVAIGTSVECWVTSDESPLHDTRHTSHVTLSVSDTGLGMDEETRQRCLDPFFTTKGERGTGMGLMMVFGTVVRHEGTIEVESEIGKGTTVTLRLPVMDMKEPAPAPRATTQPIRRLRILIVDDESAVRSVLTAILDRDGHTVETATNGREGLEKFQTGRYDLVITDRSMPEMNGDQLAFAIKQRAPAVPVVMLTGFGDFMDATGEKPAGVDVLLGKPVKPMQLREAMERVTA